MKKFTFLILSLIISSCNLDQNSTTDADLMLGILYSQTEETIIYVKDDIHAKILRIDYDSISKLKIRKYDNLTKQYISYLRNIENQFFETTSNPFFENGAYSEEGKGYLKKTNFYKNEILELIGDSQLKNSVNSKVGTYNIVAINGRELKHLDYIYDNTSRKGIALYLKLREKNILELEKDYINTFIIKPEPEFVLRKK